MAHHRTAPLPLVAALLCLGLTACQPSTAPAPPSRTLFLPRLADRPLTGLLLQDGQSTTALSLIDGAWQVTAPFSYPANQVSISSFLHTLATAEILQTTSVAAQGLSRLALEDPDTTTTATTTGIKLTFSSGAAPPIAHILGKIIPPPDLTDAQALGLHGAKQRYARSSENLSHVHVINHGLVSLRADPNAWFDDALITLSRIKEYRSQTKGQPTVHVTRSGAWSPLQDRLHPQRKVSPEVTRYLDHLFNLNRVAGIAPATASESALGIQPDTSFTITDSRGLTVTLFPGTQAFPVPDIAARFSELQESIFTESEAPIRELFPVKIQIGPLPAAISIAERRLLEARLPLIHRTIYLLPAILLAPTPLPSMSRHE